MKIQEELAETIAKADISILFNHFRLLKLDGTITEKQYNKVRFGVKEVFDIHNYIDEYYNIKMKSGIVTIEDKEMTLKEFRNEIEEREDMMRLIIYENMNVIEITEGRTKFE